MPRTLRGPTKGGLNRWMRQVRASKSLSVRTVRVGWPKTARYPDGTPMAAVAAWNEFGTEMNGRQHVPERPYFRQAIIKAKPDLLEAMKKHIDPMTLAFDRRVAGIVGQVMVGHIQRSITQLRDPPNAEVTIKGGWIRTKSGWWIKIKGKGSSNPLIDTGDMRRGVTYIIEQ